MKSKTWILVVGLIFAILSIAAGRQIKERNEQKTIYLINKSKYGYENTAVVNGAKSAAKEYGVDLQVLAPDSEKDLNTQKSLIEEAYANRPYGVIICPIETVEITNKLGEINKQEIKTVLVNNEPNLSGGFERIGYDNKKIGKEIASRIWSGENLFIVNVYQSLEGMTETNSIINGMKQHFGDAVSLNIYDDMPSADHLYKPIVVKHLEEDVDAIVCLDEASLLGLVKCREILPNSLIVGINSSIDVIRNIDSGNIDEIYVLNYFEYGYNAVLNIIDKSAKDSEKGTLIVVDKENLFDPNIEKLVFPLN